jgi:hypothetical protein
MEALSIDNSTAKEKSMVADTAYRLSNGTVVAINYPDRTNKDCYTRAAGYQTRIDIIDPETGEVLGQFKVANDPDVGFVIVHAGDGR